MSAARAGEHLRRLAALPRPAGSPAEQEARAYCATVLGALGFTVRDVPFEYSALPGRLGTPAAGLAALVVVLPASLAAWREGALTALGILLIGGAMIAAAGRWMSRRGVLDSPWLRARSTNLVATRREPVVWLVAHLDSKSQPIPILARALGITALIAVWGIAVIVAVAQAFGRPLHGAWPWVAAAAAIASLPVIASVVGARSPGALDDASGVATVLRAVELAPAAAPLGVLLTSAEELGLAGARAWVRDGGARAGTAINVDGVDDEGALRLTYGGSRPTTLLKPLLDAARSESVAARAGRLWPGVLVDGVALADGGWRVVTMSKGTWKTVARIHTPRDDAARLDGTGVETAARVIAAAIGRLG